jgi:hypothetical protein
MTQEEVRKLIREEICSLLKIYDEVKDYRHLRIDRYGNAIGDYPYSKGEIIDILIDKLNSNEVE